MVKQELNVVYVSLFGHTRNLMGYTNGKEFYLVCVDFGEQRHIILF
jgi:hypothetical protein